MTVRDYIDKLRLYFWFSAKEFWAFVGVVVGLAIIHSWNLWGTQRFEASVGLTNLLQAMVFVSITVFLHHAGQRMMALALGFRAEHKMWWNGLLAGLILAMLSNGKIAFLAATATMEHLLPIHRLGAFRHGANIATLAKIAMAGPALNIAFAGLVKMIEFAGFLNPYVSNQLFGLNIAFALWNLLPIPPLDGTKILYWSRMIYVWLVAAVGSYAFLAFFFNFYSYLAAVILGTVLTIIVFLILGKEWL